VLLRQQRSDEDLRTEVFDECLFAVTIPKRFAHPDLAGPIVVIPTVVQEINTSIDGGAHNTNRHPLINVFQPKMPASNPDRRYLFSCTSKYSINHLMTSFRRVPLRLSGQDHDGAHHLVILVLQVVAVPDILSPGGVKGIRVHSGHRTSRAAQRGSPGGPTGLRCG
jgi:hypothetical protein